MKDKEIKEILKDFEARLKKLEAQVKAIFNMKIKEKLEELKNLRKS